VALEAGAKLVIINQGETPFDANAHLRLDEKIDEVLPPAIMRLNELLKKTD
jgi:NAD-dependent SIR2 family protein deacetylase